MDSEHEKLTPLKDKGMCPHGNFGEICATCKEEERKEHSAAKTGGSIEDVYNDMFLPVLRSTKSNPALHSKIQEFRDYLLGLTKSDMENDSDVDDEKHLHKLQEAKKDFQKEFSIPYEKVSAPLFFKSSSVLEGMAIITEILPKILNDTEKQTTNELKSFFRNENAEDYLYEIHTSYTQERDRIRETTDGREVVVPGEIRVIENRVEIGDLDKLLRQKIQWLRSSGKNVKFEIAAIEKDIEVFEDKSDAIDLLNKLRDIIVWNKTVFDNFPHEIIENGIKYQDDEGRRIIYKIINNSAIQTAFSKSPREKEILYDGYCQFAHIGPAKFDGNVSIEKLHGLANHIEESLGKINILEPKRTEQDEIFKPSLL